MRTFRLVPAATHGARWMYNYLKKNFSEQRAEREQINLRAKIEKLVHDPQLGRPVRLAGQAIRTYRFHENARIYFTATDTELVVLLVWDTRQNAR
jgi:plasmid stabilization system protein ParE